MSDDLAQLCADLAELRIALRADPEQHALLDQVEKAARDGRPIATLLELLGIAGAAGREPVSPLRVPSHPVPGVYLCPTGRCGRWVVRRPGEALPACHLFDRALRFSPDGR
jgi:hypothetical protein